MSSSRQFPCNNDYRYPLESITIEANHISITFVYIHPVIAKLEVPILKTYMESFPSDIVMGDFNINTANKAEKIKLNSIFPAYKIHIYGCTFGRQETASSLDHVLIRETFAQATFVSSFNNIYSDHAAISVRVAIGEENVQYSDPEYVDVGDIFDNHREIYDKTSDKQRHDNAKETNSSRWSVSSESSSTSCESETLNYCLESRENNTIQTTTIHSEQEKNMPEVPSKSSKNKVKKLSLKRPSEEDKMKFQSQKKQKCFGKKSLFDCAIKVAKDHRITVIADDPNDAQGDCLFESILDNIKHRPDDFPEKLDDRVDCYRELWVTELEERYKSTEVFPGFHRNMTEVELGEWTAAWTQQKNPCEYNVDKFNVSDLTPEGLGHCINRNILVFSTDPNDPVKVFRADRFDKDIVPKSDIPVVIAYDHRGPGHYESLLPKDELDVQKCTMLVKSIEDATYDKHNPDNYLRKAQLANREQQPGESPASKRARLEKDKTEECN